MNATVRDKDSQEIVAVLENLQMTLTAGSRLWINRKKNEGKAYTITSITYYYNMEDETQGAIVYVKEWY